MLTLPFLILSQDKTTLKLDNFKPTRHTPAMRMKILISFTVVVLLVTLVFASWWRSEIHHSHQYDNHIEEASARYDISPELIRSVIWKESDFDPKVEGKVGERGLMQVTAVVGKEWAKYEKIPTFQPTDLFDPRTNIMAGSWYLAQAIRRWNQADEPIIFALAEYNAGRSQALRWFHSIPKPVGKAFFNQIDYPTTKNYIQQIMERYQLYRSKMAPGPFRSLFDKLMRRLQPTRGKNVSVETSSER